MNIPMDAFLFVSLVVRTTLLLGLGLLTLRLVRRFSPGLRYEVAVAVVATALILPVGHVLIPALNILPLETLSNQVSVPDIAGSDLSQPRSQGTSASGADAAPSPVPVSPRPSANRNVMIEAVSAVVASVRAMSVGQIMGILWFLGALGMAVRLAAARLTLGRLWNAAVQPLDDDWSDLLEEAGDRVFLTRELRIRELNGIRSPMTWGVLQPKLLLPTDAKGWTRERKLNALMHEMVHVRRMDALHDAMSALLLIVHWFNPLAWMVRAELKAGREASCDREVLHLGAEPEEYARMLIDVAKEMRSHRAAPRLAMTIARPSQLEGRVLSVLNYKGERLASTNRWLVVGVSTFMLLFIAAAAPAVPEEATLSDHASPTVDRAQPVVDGEATAMSNVTSPDEATSMTVTAPDRDAEAGAGLPFMEDDNPARALKTSRPDDLLKDPALGTMEESGWEITLEGEEDVIGDLFAVAGIKIADAVLQELGQSVEEMDWQGLLNDVDWSAEGDGWSIEGNETRDALKDIPNGDIADVMARFSNGIQNAVVVELERIVTEEPGTTKARRARKALMEIDSEASREALERLGLLSIGN